MATVLFGLLTSCNTLEKAAIHGLNSGYYKLKSENKASENVYLDVRSDQINVYHADKRQLDKKQFFTIPLNKIDSVTLIPMVLKKQSLDIDITSILLKYRLSVYDLPAQLTSDLNFALYAGWRHDYYQLMRKIDPLGRSLYNINNRGFDFGFFVGPGTALISPFNTRNKRTDEYSGMVIQSGIAGFLETDTASFGLAIGLDYLLNPDRKIWIYHRKPWVGFTIGIAIN